MSRDDLLKGLTKEQIAKARECKTSEELLALAKEEEVELTDEQLEAISGGGCANREKKGFVCPNCLGTNTTGVFSEFLFNSRGGYDCKCDECGSVFQTRG